MAVLKIMDKAYADIDAEKDVYNYIMNTDKTDGCVGGYNVFADHYLDIAPTVRRLFSNNDSHKFIHFIISYKNNYDIDNIYRDARIIASFFIDNQVVFGIHINTKNLHIHFMVNNVRFTDGYVIKDYSILRNQLTDYCNGRILEKLL